MKKGVYIGCFPQDMAREDRFRLAKDAGFDGMEVPADEELIDSTDKQRELLDLAKQTVPITSLMASAGWRTPLSSADPAERAKAVDILKRTIKTAKNLGADTVLVIPGVVNEQVAYDEAWERGLAGVRELAPVAEREGINLGVENVWNKFLLSPLEMARFVDEIGSERVGVYFDVGNVLNFGYPEQWIRILGNRIKKVHVKDFSTRVGNITGFVQLLAGDVNWPAVMAALRQIGYDGFLTAEVSPFKHHPEKGIRDLASTIGTLISS